MIKKVCILVLAFSLMLSVGVFVSADSPIQVSVDGVLIEFDVAPFRQDDRTLVPLRAIAEALDVYLHWDGENQTIFYFNNQGVAHLLTIGSNIVEVGAAAGIDPELVPIDVPPMIVNDRTFVPVRFIAESFSADVDWDQDTQTVIIASASTSGATEQVFGLDGWWRVNTTAETLRTVADSRSSVLAAGVTSYINFWGETDVLVHAYIIMLWGETRFQREIYVVDMTEEFFNGTEPMEGTFHVVASRLALRSGPIYPVRMMREEAGGNIFLWFPDLVAAGLYYISPNRTPRLVP